MTGPLTTPGSTVESRAGGSVRPRGRRSGRLRIRRVDSVFLIVAGVIIALDQVSKHLVRANLRLGESFPDDGFLRISNVSNSGAAFGVFQGQTLFLVVATVLGLSAILLYYLYPPMEHGIVRLALGFQLGGAIGNLADRLREGSVTDFIDFRWWPAFNVADSSIVVGVSVIIAFFLFQGTAPWDSRAGDQPLDAP